jgi:hypothetical protein
MFSTESPPLNDVLKLDFDAEYAPFNGVDRPKPAKPYRSSGFKNAQFTSDRLSNSRQLARSLVGFSLAISIGVGATFAWQSYGGEMIKAWLPSLGWLVPTSPSVELQALLKPVALNLAITKRSLEQLAADQDQLARKQDQMAQAFATLQAAVRDINQNISALAPLAPNKAAHVPPPKPTQPAAQ